MVEATRKEVLWGQTRRVLWRSFLVALVVGGLGIPILMSLWFLLSAFQQADTDPLAAAFVSLWYGVLLSPFFWVPVWALVAVFTLVLLWISPELYPGRARYVLAFFTGVALFLWIAVATQPSDTSLITRLTASLLAAIGVWATVPWILKPPHEK